MTCRGLTSYCLMKNNLERLDDLLIDGMKLWQRTDQFCFAIDAVLLAHFPKFNERRRYADLGTGTGVIPLLMTARGVKDITAVEVNPVLADLARRNIVLNHKESEITLVEADYCRLEGSEWVERFDGIVINPPYFTAAQGAQPQSADVNLARHETVYDILDIAKAAARLVKYQGQAFWIYPVSRLMDLLSALKEVKLEPKRMRFVHSMPGKAAKLVLIEARKAGQVGLITEVPLYIYDTPNVYSEEVRSWYERT